MNILRTEIENRIHNYAHNADMLEDDDVGFIFDRARFKFDEAYRTYTVSVLHDRDLLDLFETLVEREHTNQLDSMLSGVGV